MAVKECGSHGSNTPRLLNFIRRRIIYIIIFIIVIIMGSVLTYTTLHSPKPRFILQDATVFTFNVTGNPPNTLTSNLQTTLISRNPNGKEIYYDRLDVYASYQNQQITLATSIPSFYQGHEEVNVWSPFIGGKSVPISPSNGLSLAEEQARGAVKVLVRVDGKIRWKVGPITRTSRLFVRCPALISFGNSDAGFTLVGRGVKYTLVTVCSVSV